jgi:hypothetical protein
MSITASGNRLTYHLMMEAGQANYLCFGDDDSCALSPEE